MQPASGFLEAGLDFAEEIANGTEDIWWINEGLDYPRLWWENADRNQIPNLVGCAKGILHTRGKLSIVEFLHRLNSTFSNHYNQKKQNKK